MGSKKVAMFLILVSLVSIVMGGVFIGQGISKGNLVTSSMAAEKITYSGADGAIEGCIDTIPEAQVMAEILKEHRMGQGIYTELERDDPARQTILNAMTMENSLNLAQAASGLAQVALASGVFMLVAGLGFGVIGISNLKSRQ